MAGKKKKQKAVDDEDEHYSAGILSKDNDNVEAPAKKIKLRDQEWVNDAKATSTGYTLRHEHSNYYEDPDQLIDKRPGKTFGGKYPQVIKMLRRLYGTVKDEDNKNSLGLAKYHGWVCIWCS